MKSYDVTIQMKALCLYFYMVPFVLQFGRNLFLAKFCSEKVKAHLSDGQGRGRIQASRT